MRDLGVASLNLRRRRRRISIRTCTSMYNVMTLLSLRKLIRNINNADIKLKLKLKLIHSTYSIRNYYKLKY